MKTVLLSAHSSIPVLTARRYLPAVAVALLACLVIRPGRAADTVSDDFESYAVGSNLHGQGGWSGWAGDVSAGALVSSNFSFSPIRSVNIGGASDLVHPISGATNGQWVFSVRQYIPSTSTGTNYTVLMNTYRPPYGVADLNWSVIIQNNLAAGLVISDLGGGATRPMVKDQWVEVRCEINLASNSVSEFYNSQLLSTHPWHDSNGSNQIQALDLFANNAGPVYYDNVSLGPDCLKVSNEHLTAAADGSGKLNYSFDLKNGAGVPVKYLFLVPKTNCFTFMPDVFIFNPPLPPGQTTNLSVMINVTADCPTDLCFQLAAHDPKFALCCSLMHCATRVAGGPQLVSAVPICASNKITITFDRPLDPATALVAANYSVNDLTHGLSLPIASVSFGADQKTICLFTVGPLSASTQYRLTVNNVTDTLGNAITPNSKATFCCPDPSHRLNWTFVNGQLCLSWVCDGVLECTTSLKPPIVWTLAPNQSNPQCFMPGGAPKFFRLRQ